MIDIMFEVDDAPVPVESIMVHFKRRLPSDARPYLLYVPMRYVQEVFDPEHVCPSDTPLHVYVSELVLELETFIVSGYLQNIRRIMNMERMSPIWIIASVDEIQDTGAEFLVRGAVVPFDVSKWSGVKFVEVR